MPLRSPALRPRIIDFAVQLTPRSCFRCLQAFGLLYLSVQSDDSNRHPRPFDADDPLCAHRTEAGIREPRRSSASRPLACGQCVHASLGEPLSGLGVSHGVPDGILLGGAVDASGPDEQAVLNEAAERLVVVPELARRYPNTRILFSGGNSALMDGGSAEAEFAARLLESLGVERSRITLEDRSRNTVENAVFSKALIQPKSGDRWLLVASAYHMPRAIGVFRKAGFPAEPYPVDRRTRAAEDALWPFATMSDGLQRTDTASTNGSDSRILAHRAHLRVVSGANSRRPSKGVAALNDGQ
jgi:uncharacterized SAM-binding protein YcdF (DUF218 family)